MKLTIDINFRIIQDEKPPSWTKPILEALGRMESGMSRVEDKLAEMEGVMTSIGESVNGVQGDVTNLGTEIAALKDQLANAGNLSAEQEARFDALINSAKDAAAKLTAIDAMNPTTPPAVPEPTPDTPSA